MSSKASYHNDINQATIYCRGEWTYQGIVPIQDTWQDIEIAQEEAITIDGAELSKLDSAGAWLLQRLYRLLLSQNKQIQFKNFSKASQQLLELIAAESDEVLAPLAEKPSGSVLFRIGRATVEKYENACSFLEYIGEISLQFVDIMLRPYHFQWRNMWYVVEQTGYRALPIIGLLSFLIGIVLTYQMGLQLKTYGANIFIVNLSGMAILREFGPLITAILVAGRTSSSFTAQIGMMKLNEEVAAIRSMGLSPINRLVLPKIVATLIAVPLLTMWANIFGVFGSMVMSKGMLNINFIDFLVRFQEVVEFDNFWIGMIKSPVFALIIASVGCFQGFQVANSADSVGRQTTISVVQAIFLIIIADAIFSILFSWRGL